MGGDHGQVPSSLSAGLGCGAVWHWSRVRAVMSVLSAREGFPEAPITGLCNLCSFPLLRLLL